MNEFSSAWLRLREAADRRSRSSDVARALGTAFAGRSAVRVIEIGCGAGSNLRATAPSLGADQRWLLLDNDAALLDEARAALGGWADDAAPGAGGLVLHKDGARIAVRFRRIDAAHDPAGLLAEGADLVTASAFFDLASERFIRAFAGAVIRQRAVFHTVLTFDGRQGWTPGHAADEAVRAAFDAHQSRDKGFGPAAGPQAHAMLCHAFAEAGYRVVDGDSAWRLGPADRALMAQLNEGVAAAVAETGMLDPDTLAAWLAWSRTGAIVGHRDLLALPP